MITIDEAREILAKRYALDNYLSILSDVLLPDFSIEKHEVLFSSNLFSSIEQLGYSNQCEITVFEVKLIEGSENKRIAITQEAFRLLKSLRINNALISFVDTDEQHYRISLLSSRFALIDGKIEKIYSNPRRYSYSLGVGTKTKTAYQNLIEKGRVNNLEELTNRFSVEVVNKLFYNDIASTYTKLIGGERFGKEYNQTLVLGKVKERTKYAEFGVRLIGRLLFCWFLKEKKSDSGVSLIQNDFISTASVDQNPDYYHNILEPLFFELLNTPQRKRKAAYLEKKYQQIPYLNGGLFHPHFDDFYQLDKKNLLSKTYEVEIPDQWFKELFTIFEQYNFTVDENTAYDIELSIDPEMLGRVFENLLAEINPETGENIKKSTGSFYTPREIVSFMVDNSLLEYLSNKTDIASGKLASLIAYGSNDDDETKLTSYEKKEIIDAIYSVAIIDPACGSGAFPIGMLQKIVYILQEIDPTASLWLDKAIGNASTFLRKEFEKKFDSGSLNYIRKLAVIQNSIFGIDIQPIAIEIARLRCFLSLIIEEKVDDEEDNRGINPLPSLDFKFIVANSLIGLDSNLQMSLFENENNIHFLKEIRDEFFNAESDRRTELKLEFAEVQKNMLQDTIENSGKVASRRYKQLSDWSPFADKKTNWFDSEWMFGIKDGFDIVIGNPPYGILNKKQNQNTSILMTEEDISIIKSDKLYDPCKNRMINAYSLFIMKGFDLLKDGGINCMIFPLAFMCDLSASRLRKFILMNKTIQYIEAFPERDNENKRVFEAAKMSVCIMSCINHFQADSSFSLRISSNRFVDLSQKSILITRAVVEKIDIQNYTFPLLSEADLALMNTILRKSKRLELISKCYTGEIDLTLCKEFIKETGSADNMIRGAQVQPFYITNTISQGSLLKLNSSSYLSKYHDGKAEHHKLKRIVMQGITGINEKRRLKMSLIEKGMFCANSVNYLLVDERESLYLLGLLNSKVLNWFFKKLSTNSNVNGYEVDNLPIVFSDEYHEILSKIVESILNASDDLEREKLLKELDKTVYSIYGLSSLEIEQIEATF